MDSNKRKVSARPRKVKRETTRWIGKDRRKKIRRVHVIDDQSTDRDISIARADLTNFFLESLNKHHGF